MFWSIFLFRFSVYLQWFSLSVDFRFLFIVCSVHSLLLTFFFFLFLLPLEPSSSPHLQPSFQHYNDFNHTSPSPSFIFLFLVVSLFVSRLSQYSTLPGCFHATFRLLPNIQLYMRESIKRVNCDVWVDERSGWEFMHSCTKHHQTLNHHLLYIRT